MDSANTGVFAQAEADRGGWPISSPEDRLCALTHELRGRLQVLRLNTQIMLEGMRARDCGAPRGWLAEHLDRQLDALRSMQELMEGLLDVQAAEHAAAARAMRAVDLRALVCEILQSDGESLRSSRCSWSLQAPAAVCGDWDALQLRVAIRNLVSNASKFGAGAPLEISVGCSEQRAFVQVTDHGVGVKPEDSERIFGRFERANTQVRGSGVGLWLVRGIARAHGGEVTLRSSPGQGATFTFSLPGGRLCATPAEQR